MGALAAWVFGFIVVLIGAAVILFGIVGEALFASFMVHGKRFGKPLLVVSAVIVRLGVIVALIPILFFGLIIGSNFALPSDFVETETAIEFTDDDFGSFVADGITYVPLEDLYYCYEAVHEIWTPVFHYIPDVAIERQFAYNLYSIPNDSGYELIAGDYYLYCRAEDKNAVIDYYSSCLRTYYHDDYSYEEHGSYIDIYYRLPTNVENALDSVYSLGLESLELIEVTVYENDPIFDSTDIIYVDIVSADSAVILEYMELMYLDGRLYVYEYEDFPEGYDFESYFDIPEDERASVYGLRVLPEHTEELLVGYFIEG